MGKHRYTAGLSNELLGRKESQRYQQQAKRGDAVSAKSMIRALVWVSDNPRYWRKLCRLFRRYGMSDTSTLNWLLRDARDTVDGRSMRRIAELAHELVKLARVQEVIADN